MISKTIPFRQACTADRIAEFYKQTLPLISKVKRKPLTKSYERILYSSIKEACRQLDTVRDFLNPKLTTKQLNKQLEQLEEKCKTLRVHISQKFADQRVQASLNSAYSLTKEMKHWKEESDLPGSGFEVLIQTTKQLALIGDLISHARGHLAGTHGPTSNYRLIVIIPLLEGWIKIFGKFPTTASNSEGNTRGGPFIVFCQEFFKTFNGRSLSGSTIRNYLESANKALGYKK